MRRTSTGLRLLFAAAAVLALLSMSAGCDTTHVDSIDHMNEGIRHYNNNQITKALDELKKSVQIDPNNHRAYFQLGMIYNGRMSSFDDAIEAFSQAAKLRDDNSEYWYYLGFAHQNAASQARSQQENSKARDEFSRAKEALNKAADLDKYFVEAWFRLGQIHMELGEVAQAIDAYSNAIQADQTFPLAYKELGELYADYAFLDEAAQVLRNGVDNNPEDVALQSQLGQVYMDQERFLEALDHFEKAYSLHEQQKGEKMAVLPSFQGRAIAHEKLGDRAVLAENIAEATKQYKDAKDYYRIFIENAGDDSLRAERMQAGAAISVIEGRLADLEKGQLPQAVLDQRSMLEERSGDNAP